MIGTPIDPTGGSYAQSYLVEGAGRVLFVSGQVPADEAGAVPEGFEAQCRLAWRNVEAQLRKGGMSLANLAKVTIYLSDRRDRAANAQIRHEVLQEVSPALTVIIVDIFDSDWLLEIEAIALD